ncbi:MAG TPA: LysM peptidoglycan-binding domain-containing protein [Phycisphaerae bacterium]|nr:LysM peptidoglycan-binding domain-containing protein [Phycisphaerales bacterium]HNO77482.1 LysM peptidoglycan-binding domain-containing protein [Phycisphaerae bacterium]
MRRIATTLVALCALVTANGCKEKVEHLDTTPVRDNSYSYSYQEPASSNSNYSSTSSGSPSYDNGGRVDNYPASQNYTVTANSNQQPYTASQQSSAPANDSYGAPSGGAGGTHVVQRGETLYALARMYYNDQSKWRVIYEANRGVMSSPHSLQAGQELIIP